MEAEREGNPSPLPVSSREVWVGFGLVAAIFLASALPAVFFGRLTADEGWYLLASVSVTDGQRPYRDFLFTQMPLLPYVYGPILYIFGATLLAARTVSVVFGLGGLLLSMAAIQRRAGTFAAVLGGTIFALDLALAFDVAAFKTQALTLLLTGLAIWLATGSGRRFEIAGSIAAMTLAVLTRLSMAPVLVCFWIYWLSADGSARRVGALAAAVSLGALAATAAFFRSGGNCFFGAYEFHRAYFVGMATNTSFLWFFIKGFVGNQMPIIAAGLAAGSLLVWRKRKSKTRAAPWAPDTRLLALLMGSYLSTTALHATRLVTYPTYQTSNVLFAVVFIGLVLGRLGSSKMRRRNLIVAAWVIGLAGMPWQEYIVKFGGAGGPDKVEEAAARLRSLPRGDGRILTLSPELAVSAHLTLVPGYEMGAFSYFPGLDDDRAQQLRVVNAAKLERDLTEHPPSILALTTDALYVLARGPGRKRLTQTIASRFSMVGKVEGYGQYAEDLYLLAAR